MAIKYKQCTVEKNVTKRTKQLYQKGCVNYSGVTIDTKEIYTEVISKLILSDIDILTKDIYPVTRKRSYKVMSHKWYPYDPDAKRKEEVFARSLYKKQLGELLMLDYQVPLKDYIAKEHPGLGKIDLLAYDGASLVILELKKQDSEETLLRCVLEAYTYLKTMNTGKLAIDFYYPNIEVRAAVLVFEGSKPYSDWFCNNQPYVKELMKKLGVGLFSLKNIDDKEVKRIC